MPPARTATSDESVDINGVEPLLDYLHRCGRNLASIVSGNESALTTLFPDGSYETVDFLYHDWAVARYINGIAREAVAAASSVREFRVLEIGAGTGGTTADLLPALPADRTEYTFTDVSEFFLTRARERFSDYPFVRYTLLDIERSPTDQGLIEGGFDVVVASNVLHATRNLDVTLTNVRSLLAPGGLLVAYEATHHPRWFDVTTGLIEGWQRFEDSWRADNPLLDTERWTAALTTAGFETVVALPGTDLASEVLGQHLLLARAPGIEQSVIPRSDHDGDAVQRVGLTDADIPVRSEIDERLADALDDERHDVFVDVVRRCVAHVLRIGDAHRLPRERPLLELGLDSLMAVELRNVLRISLAISGPLPATLVFDHPNIAAIARFVQAIDEAPDDRHGQDEHPLGPTHDIELATAPTTAEDLAGLTDDEVEAMLLERLADGSFGTTT